MTGGPEWEEWLRRQLAGLEAAALRAHRRARVGRAAATAFAIVSVLGCLLVLGLALGAGDPPKHPPVKNGPLDTHW